MFRSMTRSGWRRSAVAIGTAALVVTACGGDDDVASVVTTSPTATSDEQSLLPTPSSTGTEAYPEGTALRFLRGDERFTTLVGILESRDIGAAVRMWSNPNHDATIIAPTDDAFAELSPDLRSALLEDDVVARVVMNHVTSDPFTAAELVGAGSVQTLGVALDVAQSGDEVSVGGVPIAEPDVVIGRTVIHVVDQLILPCHDAFLAGQLGEAFTDTCRG